MRVGRERGNLDKSSEDEGAFGTELVSLKGYLKIYAALERALNVPAPVLVGVEQLIRRGGVLRRGSGAQRAAGQG